MSDETPDGNGITLNMDIDRATKLYARMVRARNGIRMALESGDMGSLGFYFGWLDADLTEAADSVSDEIKAEARSDMARMRKDGAVPFGGGAKPV